MLKLVHFHQSPSSQLQPLASLKTTQKNSSVAANKQPSPAPRFCSSCGRRHFIEASTAAFLPISPSKSNASSLHSDDYLDLLNKIHPPRPDWYEEFYASVTDTSMKSYEAKVKRVLKPGELFLSVEHVAAKDGTSLKFWQTNVDPLLQTVADGCRLTRETG